MRISPKYSEGKGMTKADALRWFMDRNIRYKIEDLVDGSTEINDGEFVLRIGDRSVNAKIYRSPKSVKYEFKLGDSSVCLKIDKRYCVMFVDPPLSTVKKFEINSRHEFMNAVSQTLTYTKN